MTSTFARSTGNICKKYFPAGAGARFSQSNNQAVRRFSMLKLLPSNKFVPKLVLPDVARLSSTNPTASTELRSTAACWNCSRDLADNEGDLIFCRKCGVLRVPSPTMTYFELYNMEPTFKMDLKKLAKKHKDFQKQLHPDKFTLSVEEEKNLSDSWSPLVNEGYATLKKPIRRANYLLELAGHPLKENEDLVLDPNFLAEVMEINEEIVDAEGSTDISGIIQHVRDILQNYYNRAEMAFEKGDIKNARYITAQMQYYENLKKKAVARETDMGIVH